MTAPSVRSRPAKKGRTSQTNGLTMTRINRAVEVVKREIETAFKFLIDQRYFAVLSHRNVVGMGVVLSAVIAGEPSATFSEEIHVFHN